MKLILIKGWTGSEELISENPSEEKVSKLVNSLDWSDFNSVRLQHDDENWIDVSGNVQPDGLAIVYEEHGIQHISDEAPDSISQLEEALIYYLKRDSRYKNFGFSSDEETSSTNKNKESEYDLWKIQYEAREKIEKRNNRITVIVSIVITGFICQFIYLWFTDELKFIGHDTDHVIATVTEIKLKYDFRGNLYQLVRYEFDYKGNRFKGYCRGTGFTGKFRIDDRLKIKFSTDDPTISKRVAKMVRNL